MKFGGKDHTNEEIIQEFFFFQDSTIIFYFIAIFQKCQ